MGVSAMECNTEQIEVLYNALSPNYTIHSGSYSIFASREGNHCKDSRERWETLGDTYSQTFIDDFCRCGININNNVIRDMETEATVTDDHPEGILLDCTINGQTPYGLLEACDSL